MYFWGAAEGLVTMSERKMEFCFRMLLWFPSVGTTALETLDPQIHIWHSLEPSLMRSFEVGLTWARPKQGYLQCALKNWALGIGNIGRLVETWFFSCPFAVFYLCLLLYLKLWHVFEIIPENCNLVFHMRGK